ncbi:MAG: type II secretion system ATPase GspE [Candidatus Omnitrophica bacterium]|nr:type II secretion system ATPase GspE [Candidatus Omnitrophota bacterium]MBU2436895.1 type II secretion system ATPase GspE [Candidatus Omnitrophota bacterium]
MIKRQKKSLGESLVEEGIITLEQLREVKEEEKRSGTRLRKVLVNKGLIAEEDLVAFLSNKLGLPRIELSNYLISSKIIEFVPEGLARKYELIPVLKIGNRLTCAMVDPWNVFALDEVRAATGFIIEPAVATETEIRKALNEHYGAKGTIEEIIKSIDQEKPLLEQKSIDANELQGIAEEPVVIKLVNLIIVKAIGERASDIHIEPQEDTLRIRFRVDGMLHEVDSPPKHVQSAVISRIKIMANLDIAERRIPQDGRFTVKVEGREVDVRVSCVPTIFGENVVLRLLDVSTALRGLSQLGFSKVVLENYDKLIKHPYGIILVTGPTGSGKTTTLYASLDKINTEEKNIITVEDPVEYKLSGIRQIQVNPKVNLTFANGLRSILRQDPDVIMVGEIRDFETAEIAIQAALTGHLVFSTLHTNDAASSVVRLINMGVEPYLIASSLAGVLAQRLVRTICEDCKESYEPQAGSSQLKDLGLKADSRKLKAYRGKGCPKCMHTGYKGRVALFELLSVDDKLRKLIIDKAPQGEIKLNARSSGMVSLMADGIEKVRQGLTTIEEVLRVTQEE